jgi:hypothetical protein
MNRRVRMLCLSVATTITGAVLLSSPGLMLVTNGHAATASSHTPACVASQIRIGGHWSFIFPAKAPAVGGRVTAKAVLVLTNKRKNSCAFQRKWPKIHLLNAMDAKLRVPEKRLDRQDVAGTPILPPKGTAAAEVINFRWINWCGDKPALPIHVLYEIVPTRSMMLITPRLGKKHRFFIPGCVNPEASSVLYVKPYLAVALPSH